MWIWCNIRYIVVILLIYEAWSQDASRENQHRHRKRRIPRPQQESSIFHQSNVSYGYSLPSFSLDYSEFILGAIIERSSDSRELHLAIFMLDVKIIATTENLIDAVSTEIATYESWSNAFKTITNTQTNSVHSGHICNLHNNDPKHKVAYHSPACKVQISSNASSFINILRCRLRGTENIYSHLSMTNKSLHVDLLRRSWKHSTNMSTETAVDPKTWLLSFSVPWRTRITGYGFHFNSESTSINPWQISQSKETVSSIEKKKYALCAGVSQPLHPTRSSVPLLSLIEFIEYHLSSRVGYHHIFISLLLDQNSPELQRHIAVLSPYIKADQVTLTTVGYYGYDNVPGIASAGIVFKLTDIIRTIFMNQCLYFAKGIFDVIGIANPSDFLIPISRVQSNSGLLNFLYRSKARRLLTSLKKSLSHGKESSIYHPKTPRVPRNMSSSHNFNLTRKSILPHHLNTAAIQTCDFNASSAERSHLHQSFLLAYYGIADPVDSFGGWGPGESSWSRGEIHCRCRSVLLV